MKKLLYIAVPLVAALGVGTFFLFGRQSDAYLNALPADVQALARLDVPAMADDAQLSLADVANIVSPSAAEKADLGVDFLRPLFAFAASTGNFGLVASLADEKVFTSTCEKLHAEGRASAVAHQRGYSWVVLKEQWVCAFDGKRALVMGPAIGSAQDQLRTEMARLLSQKKGQSGRETAFFKRLASSSGAAVAMVGPELLPVKASKLLGKADIHSHDDALLRLSLNARNNTIQIDANVEPLTAEVEKQMEHLGDLFRPIRGELLPFCHSNTTAWIGMNVKGEELLKLLRSQKSARTALMAMNMALDFDHILSSVDGDVALEFTPDFKFSPKNLVSFKFHGVNFLASLSDSSCFDGSSAWGNSFVDVSKLGTLDFALDVASERYFLGSQDNILYLGSQHGLSRDGNVQIAAGNIAGTRLYATFGIPQLVRLASGLTSVPHALRRFERATLELDKDNVAHLRMIAPEGTQIVKELLPK